MKKGIIAAIGICLALAGAGVASADDITADVITYNGKTKVVSASGNVVIHANQGATITGKSGEYRFEDRSAYLEGGVHYVNRRPWMRPKSTCTRIRPFMQSVMWLLMNGWKSVS